MFDLFSDIFSSLGKNKLRTVLTGLSMAWGIFMLVALLGCGNGVMNAMLLNFRGRSTNVATIYPGTTSKPYGGFQSGRRIVIDDKVLKLLKERMEEIGIIAPARTKWDALESYGDEYIGGGCLFGITPEYCELNDLYISKGRLVNREDHERMRKVIVLHQGNADILFKDEDPIGKYITVSGIPYEVVGIYRTSSQSQQKPDLVPLSTMMKIYPTSFGYERILLEVNSVTDRASSDFFEEKLRSTLASSCSYDPSDESPIWIWNQAGDYLKTKSIFSGIRLFLWLIAIGTLIAGIVGISNIMLVTVRERTKEFGIRKSLGATPSSIMKMIITEALTVTLGFGYLGLLSGVLLLEGLSRLFPSPDSFNSDNNAIFVEPGIDIGIALAALLILVVAGILASYVPSRKAVKIKPLEAMHYE